MKNTFNLVEVHNVEEAAMVRVIDPHEQAAIVEGKLYDVRTNETIKYDWFGNEYLEIEYYIIDEDNKENYGVISEWSQIELFKIA